MSTPLKAQILQVARALIRDERYWCRNELARDKAGSSVSPLDERAERRCALGALIAAAYQLTNDSSLAHHLAISAVKPRYGSATLIHINDERGHAAVLALFDQAIVEM
jgi:hypothetical protein